jgi:hypothetical protein
VNQYKDFEYALSEYANAVANRAPYDELMNRYQELMKLYVKAYSGGK